MLAMDQETLLSAPTVLVTAQSIFISHAFVGGILIGTGALILLAGIGRVAGISGIIGGLLKFPKGDMAWRIAFLVGLVGGGFVIRELYPNTQPPIFFMPMSYYVIAGLLVGFGTQWGSGCTSGHGVCGLARFSLRSLVAVVTFMLTGMLTVYFFHHSGGTP